MHTEFHIPTSVGEITCDWLAKALNQSGKLGTTTITGCKAKAVAYQGHNSLALRLSLEGDSSITRLPSTLIAKMRKADEDALAKLAGPASFTGEVGFYTDIIEPGLPVPICYFASENASGDFILLLEDLGEQRPLQSVDDVTIALEHAARMHAKWWHSSSLKSFDWVKPDDPVAFLATVESTLVEFRARPQTKGLLSNEAYRFIDFYLGHATRIEALKSPARTLVHADYWPGQLFFPIPEREELYVIDWQHVRVDSPTIDTCRIILDALGAGLSRSQEPLWREHYFKTLMDAGVQDYSSTDYARDYRFDLIRGLLIWVSACLHFPDDQVHIMSPRFEAVLWAIDQHNAFDHLRQALQ